MRWNFTSSRPDFFSILVNVYGVAFVIVKKSSKLKKYGRFKNNLYGSRAQKSHHSRGFKFS